MVPRSVGKLFLGAVRAVARTPDAEHFQRGLA